MANVLLIGGGGREHAIAEAIMRSKKSPKLYAVMENENIGIKRLCKSIYRKKETEPSIIDYALENGIELAVIGPETPLKEGISDLLWDAGIPVVGPRKACAQIEFDKAWARNLMADYNISGLPALKIFKKGESGAYRYIEELYAEKGDIVIKPAGLTGGKGVRLTPDHFGITGAKTYAAEILKTGDLLVEERLIGEEFTIQAFVDGNTLAFSPAVQDHKRAYEGDKGPNTGGMGSYTGPGLFLPFMQPEDYESAAKIMQDTVQAIKKKTGTPYQGILYGQFMATAEGISVIEFNARFGDPEAMNVLPLLKADFLDVCDAIVNGYLHNINVDFESAATVFKYYVSGSPGNGYPEKPSGVSEIKIGDIENAEVIFAKAFENEGKFYVPGLKTGVRLLGVLGLGKSICDAEKKSAAGMHEISGDIYHREDIGTKPLVQKRIDNMNNLRGAYAA